MIKMTKLKNFKEINKKRLELNDESRILTIIAISCPFDKTKQVRQIQDEKYKKFKFYDGLLKELNK